jgi:multidrug resistance efflux pump
MKRKGILVLLVLLIGAGAAWLWWYVRQRQAGERLELSGSIEANTVEVGSLVGGRVARVLVAEGDTVRSGQPLLAFESDLPDLELAQQRAVVAQAEAELARVRRGPRDEERRQARIEYDSAETDRRRFEALWKAGVASKRDYDAATVKAATAREALRAADRGGRPEDVLAAQAALDQQRKRLDFLERQHRELVVAAPSDGIVEVLDLRPGDLVAKDQPVATLLEPGQIWVRVYVPETQLGRVRIGQPVAIQVDTFPDRAFAGRVIEVRTQAEYTPRNVQTVDQRADQVFGVKVAIDARPELKPGMAAMVVLDEPGPAARATVGPPQ